MIEWDHLSNIWLYHKRDRSKSCISLLSINIRFKFILKCSGRYKGYQKRVDETSHWLYLHITNSTWLSQLADEEIQNSLLVVPGKVNQKLFPYPKNTWVGEKTLITKAKRTQTLSHKLGLPSNSFICLISNLLGYFVSKLQSIAIFRRATYVALTWSKHLTTECMVWI